MCLEALVQQFFWEPVIAVWALPQGLQIVPSQSSIDAISGGSVYRGSAWKSMPSQEDIFTEGLRGSTVEKQVAGQDPNLNLHVLPYCETMEMYGAPWTYGPGVCIRMRQNVRPCVILEFKKSVCPILQ